MAMAPSESMNTASTANPDARRRAASATQKNAVAVITKVACSTRCRPGCWAAAW